MTDSRAAIPTVHLIHGFAGAGKTTLARQLACDLRAVRLTHDEWMRALYGHTPSADQFRALHEHVEALIWLYTSQLLALGIDVILDHGFWSRASRDDARERIAALGARASLYEVTCPEPLMRERVLARSRNLPADALWINEAAFDQFQARYEPLGPDEARIRVDGSHLAQRATADVPKRCCRQNDQGAPSLDH